MTDQQRKPTFYEHFGGYDVVHAFVGEASKTCMKYPDIGRIQAHVSESSSQKEHTNLVDFLCRRWSGNTVYRGRGMVTIHRGMGLTEVHWKAIFEAIDERYENFNVPQDIREEIIAFLARSRPAIIGSPSYRDMALAYPDMDVAKGMKSVGIHWPKTDKPS